jgi:hypothetical protein
VLQIGKYEIEKAKDISEPLRIYQRLMVIHHIYPDDGDGGDFENADF